MRETGRVIGARSPRVKELSVRYVDEYRRLDQAVTEHESAAEKYATLAEQDKWERARIAFEATESDEFTIRSFADAVGKNKSTISRQKAVWVNRVRGAAYTDVWNSVVGEADRPAAGSTNRAKQQIGRLSTQEKADLVSDLVEDQDVATAIASNPKARASLAAAEARRDDDIEGQMRERHPDYAKAASSSAVSDVIYASSKFRGALRRAAESLRDADISTDDRDAVRHANQQVRDDIDVFEAVALEDDLDAQFAALAEGGQ